MGALGDEEAVEELRRVRRLIARLEARSAELIELAARRGLPRAEGFGSVTGWLVAVTGDPAPVCCSRAEVARELRSMPVTRAAFAAGELSEPRVRLLVQCRRAAPELFGRDEALLVSQARSLPARVFPRAVAHWRRLADADGAVADAGRAFECRRLQVSATRAGPVRLGGDLGPAPGSLVMTALASLADPAALDPQDGRTPSQRRADALVEICRCHLDSPGRPVVGGERPHLTVIVDLATLSGRGEPLVDLEAGPITAEAVRRLACDAAVIPAVAGADGRVLAVGPGSGSSPRPCAGPSTGGIRVAAIPAATCLPAGVTRTTSSIGPRAGRPSWPTAACSVGDTTAWPTTRGSEALASCRRFSRPGAAPLRNTAFTDRQPPGNRLPVARPGCPHAEER